MATAYAWSDIHVGEAKVDQTTPGKTTVIKFGDTVTADQVGGKDAFEAMLASGSIRELKPPNMPATFQGSPLDYLREQRAKMSEEELLVTTGGSNFAPSEAQVLTGEAAPPATSSTTTATDKK